MSKAWMVRAGEGGRLIEEFSQGYVAIGWGALGDLNQFTGIDDLRARHIEAYPNAKPGFVSNAVAMVHKFWKEIAIGDHVVTYDPSKRRYLVGLVTGDYQYLHNVVGEYPQVRTVDWIAEVSRDDLSVASRNSLGSTLTLFGLNDEVWANISRVMSGVAEPNEIDSTLEETDILGDVKERSREFIKDKITGLDWDEFQELIAGVLRAMGYKTRVTPTGADRGVDILASPDGFGFEQPRIVVECKHRKEAMGSQEIRSFLGGRHKDDKGLYVSTGGFTKDARYEAERANIPVTLMDLDQLVDVIIEYYEQMDSEMRTLLPLLKVYWPV